MADNTTRPAGGVSEVVRDFWREAQRATAATETHIARFITKLAETGSVTQEEAARVFGSTLRRLRRHREDASAEFDGRLERQTRILGVPTRAEVDQLRQRIEQLRRRTDGIAANLERMP